MLDKNLYASHLDDPLRQASAALDLARTDAGFSLILPVLFSQSVVIAGRCTSLILRFLITLLL